MKIQYQYIYQFVKNPKFLVNISKVFYYKYRFSNPNSFKLFVELILKYYSLVLKNIDSSVV